jgi:hypothetical protein
MTVGAQRTKGSPARGGVWWTTNEKGPPTCRAKRVAVRTLVVIELFLGDSDEKYF